MTAAAAAFLLGDEACSQARRSRGCEQDTGGIELMTGKYAEDNEGYCVILTPDECRWLEDTLRRARGDEEEAFARRRLGCFRGSSGSSRRSPS